jgi:hypothetical protein
VAGNTGTGRAPRGSTAAPDLFALHADTVPTTANKAPAAMRLPD